MQRMEPSEAQLWVLAADLSVKTQTIKLTKVKYIFLLAVLSEKFCQVRC